MKRKPKPFFKFVRERQRIKLLRDTGVPPPWTADEIIQSFRFCNVFREDDKTTAWFRDNIRDPLDNDPFVAFATVAFRWFNLISTGEIIKPFLLEKRWPQEEIRRLLRDKTPLVTGAYMIKSPNGMNKLDGILWSLEEFKKDPLPRFLDSGRSTLETAHSIFMDSPYLGRFMAYEAITDLRHTYLLRGTSDIYTWASWGPGAARGLGWIIADDPDWFPNYTSRKMQLAMQAEGTRLLELSRQDDYWPKGWQQWEMRDVEHALCEYDKWRRGKAGQRLKRNYAGH